MCTPPGLPASVHALPRRDQTKVPFPRRGGLSIVAAVTVRSRFALAAALVYAPGLACADALNDKFSLSVGGFLLTTNTTVRVDGTKEPGTPVNLEHELGGSIGLPVLGIHYLWQFTPQLNLDALVEIFGLKFDRFSY